MRWPCPSSSAAWPGRPVDSAGSTGSAAAEAAGHQAMVFQRPIMLRRSVAANVGYALKLRGLNGHDRRARTAAALTRTGLSHLAAQPARALSVGEQQRLALARAWAIE